MPGLIRARCGSGCNNPTGPGGLVFDLLSRWETMGAPLGVTGTLLSSCRDKGKDLDSCAAPHRVHSCTSLNKRSVAETRSAEALIARSDSGMMDGPAAPGQTCKLVRFIVQNSKKSSKNERFRFFFCCCRLFFEITAIEPQTAMILTVL